jgi:flavodoxin long chain
MTTIGLFYGSSASNTEYVAYEMGDLLKGYDDVTAEIHNIGMSKAKDVDAYHDLILGIPTWDIGELQADWDAFWPEFEDINFNGKQIAIFGLGDQYGYADTFLDALGILGLELEARGATLHGFWPTDGYEFTESLALTGNQFMGLAIDEDGQPEKTSERIEKWIPQVLTEFGILEKKAAAT